MLKPLRCDFLAGPLTNSESMDQLKSSFEQQSASIHEMLYYKKNGTGIWVEVKLPLHWNCLLSHKDIKFNEVVSDSGYP